MEKLLYSLTALCLFVSLISCESLRQEVDPDRLNREAAKLVVTCFLSPQDTVLAAKLTRTQTVLDEGTALGTTNNDNVVDATVSLSGGGQSVLLRYDAKLGFYKATVRQLPIASGRTYALNVQTPTGERAESTCIIPETVKVIGITLDSAQDNRFGNQGRRFFVRALWQDPIKSVNFYQVSGQLRYVGTCTNCLPNQLEREEFGSVYFDEGRENAAYLNDRNTNGQPMSSPRAYITGWANYVYLSGPQTGAFGGLKSAQVVISLLNTDQAYYQYQDAVQRQSQVSGNPFAEPVPIPSNIQGALGCFGAYNRSTLTLQLK